jgi:hypothetical protein
VRYGNALVDAGLAILLVLAPLELIALQEELVSIAGVGGTALVDAGLDDTVPSWPFPAAAEVVLGLLSLPLSLPLSSSESTTGSR